MLTWRSCQTWQNQWWRERESNLEQRKICCASNWSMTGGGQLHAVRCPCHTCQFWSQNGQTMKLSNFMFHLKFELTWAEQADSRDTHKLTRNFSLTKNTQWWSRHRYFTSCELILVCPNKANSCLPANLPALMGLATTHLRQFWWDRMILILPVKKVFRTEFLKSA